MTRQWHGLEHVILGGPKFANAVCMEALNRAQLGMTAKTVDYLGISFGIPAGPVKNSRSSGGRLAPKARTPSVSVPCGNTVFTLQRQMFIMAQTRSLLIEALNSLNPGPESACKSASILCTMTHFRCSLKSAALAWYIRR